MTTKQRNPAVISRERLRQVRKIERGLCSVAACKRKLSKGGRCKEHAQENTDRALAYYYRNRPKNLPTVTCGKCGKEGHNRRRCGK